MLRFAKACVVGLGVAGLGGILAFTPLGLTIEERVGLSWLFWGRGPIDAPDDVVVVSLDRRSAEQLGLPEKIRDWPRTLHAQLIDRLTEAGISMIAFDLILERERNPRQDAALATAIERSRRVVLFESLDLHRRPVPEASGASVGLLETEQLRGPLPAFAEAAAGIAPFPLPRVPDRVSQFWVFKAGAGGPPTLPAVTLQRQALSAHAEWLTLLQAASFPGVDSLPSNPADLRRAAGLRRYMIQLRLAFQSDSTLGQRLAAQLVDMELGPDQRRLLAALITLYDGPNSRYINFYGPAGQIKTISLHELLSGELVSIAAELGNLAGRVVFVGQSELLNLHADGFITVFSRADGVQLSGVEIAATGFANLLNGHLIQPASVGLTLALLVGLGMTMGVMAALLPAFAAVPCTVGLAALYYAAAQIALARIQVWLPVTIPLLIQLPLALFTGLLIQYRDAQHARANISRAIRYYLPEKVAAGFAVAPLNPAAVEEETYGICLISDAEGFTHLAEGMTSKALKPFLDDYLETIFAAVKQNGGIITDIVGDGVTCVWPSAVPERTHRLQACTAALEIDYAMAAFNHRHRPRGLSTRVGLNGGWVTVGNVGGSGRFAYTVVGDAANTASRIEQLNKQLGTRLLASGDVVADLDELVVRPLGRFQFVGKDEVLPIAEILRSEDAARYQRLLERFAEALACFGGQRWSEAAERFAALEAEFGDGAARFYLEICKRYLGGAPPPPDPGVIRLQRK